MKYLVEYFHNGSQTWQSGNIFPNPVDTLAKAQEAVGKYSLPRGLLYRISEVEEVAEEVLLQYLTPTQKLAKIKKILEG